MKREVCKQTNSISEARHYLGVVIKQAFFQCQGQLRLHALLHQGHPVLDVASRFEVFAQTHVLVFPRHHLQNVNAALFGAESQLHLMMIIVRV